MTIQAASGAVEILADLIAFPTVSRDPNLALIHYVRDRLAAVGVTATVIPNATGTKANLFATIGPDDRAGVMLSGHTDVVPVEGQDWSSDPFHLIERDGRLYGRGTADMKGFVAAALALAERAAGRDLATPLHLAFSYDEEVGCLGVPSLIEHIEAGPIRPVFTIVGEPTDMAVATGHKGKTAFRAICRGREAHSALAPTGLNAIHLAADLVQALRAEQALLEAKGPRDGDYDIPYSTVHAGLIEGGVALNIVPNHAMLDYETRTLAEENSDALHARLGAAAEEIASAARAHAPEASIEIEERFAYPGLATAPDAAIVDFVKGLTGGNATIKVAFGTEGGLFAARLGLPVVVCGPGSMAQGHKPDEYVSREQMARCDAMMVALLAQLEAGL